MDERCLFFVKQRTAYEMRISDWSSDVCSSDLDHPDAFDAALGRRGLEPRAADLIALDERHRAVITEVQAGQARRNEASKAIGAAKAQKDEATAQALMAEVDRKSVVEGKSVSVRVDLGGRRIIKKKTHHNKNRKINTEKPQNHPNILHKKQ